MVDECLFECGFDQAFGLWEAEEFDYDGVFEDVGGLGDGESFGGQFEEGCFAAAFGQAFVQ